MNPSPQNEGVLAKVTREVKPLVARRSLFKANLVAKRPQIDKLLSWKVAARQRKLQIFPQTEFR
jgi:hypothetical protein